MGKGDGEGSKWRGKPRIEQRGLVVSDQDEEVVAAMGAGAIPLIKEGHNA